MSAPRDRSFRRHQMEKYKRKAKQLYNGLAKHSKRLTGIYARTRQVCSCYMCGNPRRKLGEITMQERRANQDAP